MRGVIIPQTISGCITIGASIRRAKSQKESFIEEVADSVGGRVLFQGRVTQKIWESRDGYMIGHVELEGEKQFLGHTFKIWFKNDYHVSWLDQKPFVTSPDIISIIDVHSTEVPANTDIDRGNRLGVIGLKAAEAYRTRKGCEVLGPSHFGFGIDYVPIEERVRSR